MTTAPLDDLAALLAPLHAPFTCKSLKAHNRFCMAPMSRYFAPGGVLTDDGAEALASPTDAILPTALAGEGPLLALSVEASAGEYRAGDAEHDGHDSSTVADRRNRHPEKIEALNAADRRAHHDRAEKRAHDRLLDAELREWQAEGRLARLDRVFSRDDDDAPCVLALDDAAVATSGTRWQRFEADGRAYAHTIDPRSGRPVEDAPVAVSVVAREAMPADAWATALTVLGPFDGPEFAEAMGVAAHFVERTPRGLVERMTPAFAAMMDEEEA